MLKTMNGPSIGCIECIEFTLPTPIGACSVGLVVYYMQYAISFAPRNFTQMKLATVALP